MEKGDAYAYEYYANANMAEALRDADSFDVINCHLGCPWIPFGVTSKTPVLHTMNTALLVDDIWVLNRYPEVSVSAQSYAQIAVLSPQSRAKIPVVYNGCDFAAFDATETPGAYLAFLGRMNPMKNPGDAIRIAQAVGMPIVLAGRPQTNTEAAYFDEQIKPLIDGKNVRYIGPVNHAEKNELLKNAAILLFPIQWSEPFGNVMIEAMACGTPVVACNGGSVSEVIDSGKTGFYADTVEELTPLVHRAMLLDRKIVREHARQRFNHQRMVDEYVKMYASLIQVTDETT
jgi:glycosyltransferase involved in cell wall biosynthesis